MARISELKHGDMIQVKSGKVGCVVRAYAAGDHYTRDTVTYTSVKNGERFGPIRYASAETVTKAAE